MIADLFLTLSRSEYVKDVAESFLGAEYMDNNEAPNRIVWIPTQDKITIGGIAGRRFTKALMPKHFGVREAGVDICIWGKSPTSDNPVDDIRATEVLLNRFFDSAQESLMGAWRVDSVTWEPRDGGELAQFGRYCRASVVFLLPVFYDASVYGLTTAPNTVVTNAEVDGGLIFVKTPRGFQYPDATAGVDYTEVAESPAP